MSWAKVNKPVPINWALNNQSTMANRYPLNRVSVPELTRKLKPPKAPPLYSLNKKPIIVARGRGLKELHRHVNRTFLGEGKDDASLARYCIV